MTDHATQQDAHRTNYRGAFDGHLAFGKRPALLIVDVVQAYVQSGSPLDLGQAGQEALAVNKQLVAAARQQGVPVIYTNVVYCKGGADGGYFFRKIPALKAFEKDSPLGAFPLGLEPAGDELVISKQYASAFYGTSLAATLCSMGIDTVLITGYSTSGCVRATATDAIQHGFIPLVIADACADRSPALHDNNLFDLGSKYAEVIDSAAAITYLGSYSGSIVS